MPDRKRSRKVIKSKTQHRITYTDVAIQTKLLAFAHIVMN